MRFALAAAALGVIGATAPAKASLIGDTVTVGGDAIFDTNVAVVGAGVEFSSTIFGSILGLSADVGATSIRFFQPGSFEQFAGDFSLSINDLDFAGFAGITGISLSVSGLIDPLGGAPFDINRFSFTADSLTMDFADTGWNRGASATITFTLAPLPVPVPEPGTLGLLGAGLVGLAGFARRRRAPGRRA
jgi:hypothetical protein